MKVWQGLLLVIVANVLFLWLTLALVLSTVRVASGGCNSTEWVNNVVVQTKWFCK